MKIAILGAGAIGCYLGANLQQEGHDVHFYGRQSMLSSLTGYGLAYSDYLGQQAIIAQPQFHTNTSDAEHKADVVLVCVKCQSVSDCINDIEALATPDSLVICLQNGIGSDEILRDELPQFDILSGIVAFNVQRLKNGYFHRGTEGSIIIEKGDHPALPKLSQSLTARRINNEISADYVAATWGKLLMNLNNAINALSDLPLKQQLSLRSYRRVLPAAIDETIKLLALLNIKPTSFTAVPVNLLPFVLKLPDFVFSKLATKMLAIDPLARSSMWNDITDNRPTEIEYLNGAVVRLAKQLGQASPVNSTLYDLIKNSEAQQSGSPKISAAELASACRIND